VIPIERADVNQWLAGPVEEAGQLLRLSPVEGFGGRADRVAPASLFERA
jgi:hypothetical protein